jgi:ankyrin repeat protein
MCSDCALLLKRCFECKTKITSKEGLQDHLQLINSQKLAIAAIFANDVDSLKEFLSSYPEAVNKKVNNVSLLSAAVFSESINCVKRLLEHGANTDTQDGVTDTTPLHVACDRQNREIVELLLEAGANPSMCALSQSMNSLHTCAARGFLTGCQLILTKYPQLVNVPFIEEGVGVQPIHFATDEGHLDVVKCLVECVS